MTFKNKRGFVIAIDALLALIILFGIISTAFDALNREGSDWSQRVALVQFTHAAGKAMEESHLVSNAVISNNTTHLRSFINGWPNNYCGSVLVYANPDTNVPLFSVSKSGCGTLTGIAEVYSQGIMVPLPPDVNLFVATLHVWVNRA